MLILLAGCGRHPPLPPPEPVPTPPTRETARPAAEGIVHVVQQGQTLWRIAKTYGVAVDKLVEANDLSDPTLIETDQHLSIPGAERVLEVPPYRPGEGTAPDQARDATYIWPVAGTVSSGFGLRNGRRHTGLDIRAPSGTPVHAARAGTVDYTGAGFRGYGNLVILDHGNGYTSAYGHNDTLLVDDGSLVPRGQTIARLGNTGRSSAPHVHFEVRLEEEPLDPAFLLSHGG